MVRPRALKFATSLLLAAVALSFSADSAQAWWHHWGCRYWHAPVYRPVVYAPAHHHVGFGGWHGAYAYQYPSWSGTYSYAVPSYYLPSHYPTGSCCGAGLAPQYSWIVPGESIMSGDVPRPIPADVPPPLPEPPLPQPKVAPPAGEQYQLPPALGPGDSGLPAPPAPGPATDPAPAFPLLPGSSSFQPADSTILTVQVPADARVYVNGMLTKTPGTQRQYLSRGLVPGYRYTYEIRAERGGEGRVVSRTQMVEVRAGQSAQLAFRLDSQATDGVADVAETLLKLQVPEGARVTLEGQATRASGSERVFLSRQLSHGQLWEGYRVVVQLERDGTLQTREKTIDLIGGRSHELSFDFAPQQVAWR